MKDPNITAPVEEKAVEADDVESRSSRYHEDAAARVALARRLSSRQVQMIAIAGTIGSGLFLGTGKSLATGGPASLLIAYAIVGAIVYLTMLSLGEMAAYMPIAGSFGTYATRFVNEPFGFAIQWNYWANDAISTAADLVAAQILIQYWSESFPGWAVSIIFLAFLVIVNLISVRSYGELEYVLSLLKVATIIVFIILGICVNAGANTSHEYIGARYWYIGDAPFVGGIGGFASVFVTASFAYGGTESIGITAGETENPAKTIPKTVRNVFFRILIFYILSLLIVGLNVPYTYTDPDTGATLKAGSSIVSPFTIVFQQAGSRVAGSFINAVILTSVLSAGNHALFAGTRLLYALATERQAPAPFARVAAWSHVPWVALLATASVSGLCFGSSHIGAGQLWSWLQNLVGVSNQLAWVAIGIASIRFHRAMRRQGKLGRLPYRNVTQPWGPWVVVLGSSFIILVQGWSAFAPFDTSGFFSYYVELLIMPFFYFLWCVVQWRWFAMVDLDEMDLETDAIWEPGLEQEHAIGDFKRATKKEKAKRLFSWLF